MAKFHDWIEKWIQWLQSYVLRFWYAPLLGALALIDHFVLIIPTDGLLVTAVIASPKHWFRNFLWVTLGSVAGASLLAALIQSFGMPFLEWFSPGIHDSAYWRLTDSWVDLYGLWVLLAVAALPVFQHPAIAIAALADLPLGEITLYILGGRILKYGVLSWLASHAPKVLLRIKSIQKEIKEVADIKGHKASESK
ncbi:MAG: hypothetical protein AABZ55_13760 [Bdellovibrionota bacterium]